MFDVALRDTQGGPDPCQDARDLGRDADRGPRMVLSSVLFGKPWPIRRIDTQVIPNDRIRLSLGDGEQHLFAPNTQLLEHDGHRRALEAGALGGFPEPVRGLHRCGSLALGIQSVLSHSKGFVDFNVPSYPFEEMGPQPKRRPPKPDRRKLALPLRSAADHPPRKWTIFVRANDGSLRSEPTFGKRRENGVFLSEPKWKCLAARARAVVTTGGHIRRSDHDDEVFGGLENHPVFGLGDSNGVRISLFPGSVDEHGPKRHYPARLDLRWQKAHGPRVPPLAAAKESPIDQGLVRFVLAGKDSRMHSCELGQRFVLARLYDLARRDDGCGTRSRWNRSGPGTIDGEHGGCKWRPCATEGEHGERHSTHDGRTKHFEREDAARRSRTNRPKKVLFGRGCTAHGARFARFVRPEHGERAIADKLQLKPVLHGERTTPRPTR